MKLTREVLLKKHLISWILLLICQTASAVSGEDDYRQALSLNEQGRGKEALLILAELKNRFPEILRYQFDYAAVASSSGEHTAALGSVDARTENEAPHYALEALFRSAVALADMPRAERLYGLLDDRFGAAAESGMGLVHLYLRLGHYPRALMLSAELLDRYPGHMGILDLRAYVLRHSGLLGEALLAYQEIQRLFPDNRDAPKAIGMILADLGSPQLAKSSLEGEGIRLASDEYLRLLKDQGVQRIRWSAGDPDVPSLRFRNADDAIAILRAARDEAITRAASHEMIGNIRGNLVLAYQLRQYCSEAIQEYERLVADGHEIPSEIRRAAASCYSSTGRYAEAERMFHQLVEETPDSYESWSGWIYALADLERFDEAEKACRELVAMLARTDHGIPAKAADYTSARLTQAMLAAYRNRYAEAQLRLDSLQADAPASLDTTEAIGILAAWRGQPRRAEEQFRIVLGEQPGRLESRLGLANAHLDQGDATLLRQIVGEQDDDGLARRSVRESRRRLELRDSHYIVGDATFGNDQDSVAGNRTREFDLKAYSKPFGDDHWRAFGRYRDLWSNPVASVTASNASAGLRYMAVDWTTEVEAGSNGYGRLETSHSLSDHWTTNLAIEKNTFFRQARAVESGITADRVDWSLRWRQDENLDVGGGYRLTDFDDNRRSEAYLSLSKGLYADFDRRLSAAIRIGGQRNSNPEVAYFSPERQAEISGTVAFEFRSWQDMATRKSSLWHRVWVTGGEVWQTGFSAHPMSSIGYGQDIALTDAFRLRWSIARTRYPFDGENASYYTGTIGFEGYF